MTERGEGRNWVTPVEAWFLQLANSAQDFPLARQRFFPNHTTLWLKTLHTHSLLFSFLLQSTVVKCSPHLLLLLLSLAFTFVSPEKPFAHLILAYVLWRAEVAHECMSKNDYSTRLEECSWKALVGPNVSACVLGIPGICCIHLY